MSEPRVDVVLKIGGSVITDKKNELAARTQEINRIAQEIQRADLRDLIVVHGGGSFGHPYAQRYRLKEGLKEESQKIGFSGVCQKLLLIAGF